MPRQKFDNVQMALRIKDSRDKSVKLSNNNGIANEQKKKKINFELTNNFVFLLPSKLNT